MIIDGKKVSEEIRKEIKDEVLKMKRKPSLAVILVGNDPASQSYVKGKKKALAECDMDDESFELSEDVSEEYLLDLIHNLNMNDQIDGILVQLPLPKHINEEKVIMAIDPKKDVDGFSPISMGNLLIGRDCFIPCTPHGIVELLKKYNIETNGKKAVVIGRSNIVGKPISVLLSRKNINCTVTMCHTGTKNLSDETRQADIVIVASGHPHTLTKDMIKPGAVVIDVGVNRIPDSTKKSGHRLIGDCDFDDLKDVASYITPVPGGVGPMTITMLMQNTLKSALTK